VKYLLDRQIEKDLLPAAVKSEITIIAYSPLAMGLLTGKYTMNSRPTSFVQRASSGFSRTNLNKLADLRETIKKVGKAHQRTCSQVALNWLIRGQNVIAIPGAKRPSDVSDNAGAADWRLSESEIHTLERSAQINFDRLSGLPNLVRALVPF
jgi:aryl-alcohol dehydrogenase-like predicted oxidoreductase